MTTWWLEGELNEVVGNKYVTQILFFNKKNRKDPLSLVLDCVWIPAQHFRMAYLVGGVAT